MKGLPKKFPGKILGEFSLRSFRTWGGSDWDRPGDSMKIPVLAYEGRFTRG